MNSKPKLLIPVIVITVFATFSSAQTVVVDLSPDVSGTVSFTSFFFNDYDFAQVIGDEFVLLKTTEVTGGSVYLNLGVQDFGVGSMVEFGIFADDMGAPGELVVNEIRAVDAFDQNGAMTENNLRRYHVTLNSPVTLKPGTYYFAMPALMDDNCCNVSAALAVSGFLSGAGDGRNWRGQGENSDITLQSLETVGDMYLQIEGNENSVLLGDVNCDGFVNLLDVSPFVATLANGPFNEKADINQDGVVNLLDVQPFVALLSGG